jgi:hypothetical protein
MKDSLLIGEMLADSLRTRRMTWKDIHAKTQQELLNALREAMGEPTPDLSEKWVAVYVGSDLNAKEIVQAFKRQRFENQIAERFAASGFVVDCAFQEKENLVCIAAHHGPGNFPVLMTRLADRQFTGIFLDASRFPGEAPSLSFTGTTNNADEAECIRITLGAYLRSIWTLFWTAFLHPFTTTVIDLTTGKPLAELSIPYQQWEAGLYKKGSEEPVNG